MWVDKISIPSGAIKSVYEYGRTNFKYISIPSGAIKSALSFSAGFSDQEFQFLLVRLRERYGFPFKVPNPYFNSFWCD